LSPTGARRVAGQRLEDGIIIVDRDMRTILSNAAAGRLVADLGRAASASVQATPLEALARQALASRARRQHQDYSLSERASAFFRPRRPRSAQQKNAPSSFFAT
jgi:hypothetical protein